MDIGPIELVLIIVIVAMLFGVGKLPEVFGAVGKGLREFRREMNPTHDQPAKAAPKPALAESPPVRNEPDETASTSPTQPG